MNEYILMDKNHRTRRAIRPLTLALNKLLAVPYN